MTSLVYGLVQVKFHNKAKTFSCAHILLLSYQRTQPTMKKLFEDLQSYNISADKIENFLSKGKILKVKNQSLLITPGTICDKGYFVLKGGFVVRYIDKELEIEKTINFYLENFHPFMSCVDSYFSETKTQCELRAIANSEIIEFNKKDIDAEMFEDIAFFQFFHSMVTRALQEENDFKLKIISYSSERLYSYLITHCPEVIRQVPSKFIAEFMGISSEWLSKLKHRM